MPGEMPARVNLILKNQLRLDATLFHAAQRGRRGNARIAQLAELLICNQAVTGSTPVPGFSHFMKGGSNGHKYKRERDGDAIRTTHRTKAESNFIFIKKTKRKECEKQC